MRLLLLALSAAAVIGQKAAKDPKLSKGAAPNCTAVLGDFREWRDACLAPLGLSEWTVFPTPAPETSAPTSGTSAPTSGTSAPTSGTSAPTSGTSAPTSGTSAPTSGTSAPTSGTSAPTSGTSAPTSGTSAPTSGTSAPTTPATPAPPTPSPAMDACAPAGACRSFINGVEMWRGQIDWCLRAAAEAETDEVVAEQIASELKIGTQLANAGCSKNELGDLCGDGAIAELKAAGCPDGQTEVDEWVDAHGCCVASYAALSMARAELIESETPCEGEFEIGKACKAPKWKLPKKAAAKAASAGKKGKIAGAVIGGVAGLSVIGFALRKRRAKLTAAKPQKTTGQVAMVSVPVAV